MDKDTLDFVLLILSGLVSFILSTILIKYLIKQQNKKHIGQVIKDDIVITHKIKAFTPCFGGIAIFIATWLSTLIFSYSYIDIKLISLLLIFI